MKAVKEAISIVYEKEGGVDTPKIAIIRDKASSHFVLYRLEEMNGDEIQESFNGREIDARTP